MFIAKLVFAPGPGEVEWSWTHANKCFCSWGQSCCLLPDSHSYTECYCFPFIASCHSLCQSLIRTTSSHRLISHFSNFLTLHNERKGLKGIDWNKGETQSERERCASMCMCGYFFSLCEKQLESYTLGDLENEDILDHCQFWTGLQRLGIRFLLGLQLGQVIFTSVLKHDCPCFSVHHWCVCVHLVQSQHNREQLTLYIHVYPEFK